MHPYIAPLAGLLLAVYILLNVIKSLYEELASPLRHLPGPTGGNPILGHAMRLDGDYSLTQTWQDEFGSNYQYRWFFNKRQLYTTDTKALSHILVNDTLYQKGTIPRRFLGDLLGNGLLVVETEDHRRQRKIFNPAFAVPQIRALTEIFNDKSLHLRDVWLRESPRHFEGRIDVLTWLKKTTLDAIGTAGFHYEFDALQPKNGANELNEALEHVLQSPNQRRDMMRLAQASIPWLKHFPLPGSKAFTDARQKMFTLGAQLLEESKAQISAGVGEELHSGRDLLSVMVRANMASEGQKLSDSDVISQIPTFLVAGHETTSTATASVLHALSCNPGVQSNLRKELFSLATDNPTMDELNSLTYLDHVVRETMRLFPPVGFTTREAMADDVIPLSKPYVDARGLTYHSIEVKRGTTIRIPIAGVHRDKAIWGEDADLFNPERWETIPESASNVPSVWGNLFTFLAGPHNCIGFRFALCEMKSLLFVLVRAFEFREAVPKEEITFTSSPVRRPSVRIEEGKGIQMPLIVIPYSSSEA
ncbi:cytochrome P450 monooxygenase [Roridomyces roridus]|uniref:Cytochrome P450 monooxygenase n=1 Tax=Roridomyces roridus TaxID=1738132 RepID=A0AAD7FJI9_9AGAR|nr:cytochrome P450 monooxygenase [Roridomyces roridus]